MAATSTSPRRHKGESERGSGRERRHAHGRSDKPRGSDSRDEQPEAADKAPEKSERKGSFAAGFGQALPMALAGAVILIYFVWMCTELGSHSHDGIPIVLGTFGAILLGILAASLAMGLRAVSNRVQKSRR